MNPLFGYISLLLAQAGTSVKQYAMKKCGARAPGAFNSVCINMLRAAICLAVSFVIWLTSGGGVTNFSGHIIIIIAGIGTALNLLTWILASRIVSLTLIESLCMIGAMVIPMLLAPLMYEGETVSLPQWIGCALVFVSVFLFINKETSEKERCSLFKKLLIVVGCVAGISVSTVFKKYYTYHFTAKGLGSVEYFTFISFITVMIFFGTMFAICVKNERRRLVRSGSDKSIALPYKKVWLFIIAAALALYVNELFTVYAQGNLSSAVYLPLAKGLTVACVFLLDVIVFKDKVTFKKIIGLITVTAAIILVNF